MSKGETGVVVVDLQGDFTTWKGGALAVAGTDEAFVQKVSEATVSVKRMGVKIYGTQDWHPTDHVSFVTNHPGKKVLESIEINGRTQILWPPHCVQNSAGAELLLDSSVFEVIVRKGQDSRFDSYSGFQDDGGGKTGLDDVLKAGGIKVLLIYGLATDYCVKSTALDGIANGYRVVVVEDLCRGVAPETTAKALEEMRAKGIIIVKEIDPAIVASMQGFLHLEQRSPP